MLLVGASANSVEFDTNTDKPLVAFVEQWRNLDGEQKFRSDNIGGTMRLGSQEFCIQADTIAEQIYQSESAFERHRHRYEINETLIQPLLNAGLIISGRSIPDNLVETIELPKSQHPWFFGCQYHPELKSNPRSGHPAFTAFIDASLKKRRQPKSTETGAN